MPKESPRKARQRARANAYRAWQELETEERKLRRLIGEYSVPDSDAFTVSGNLPSKPSSVLGFQCLDLEGGSGDTFALIAQESSHVRMFKSTMLSQLVVSSPTMICRVLCVD